MENLQPEAASASTRPRRWPLFLMGVLLFLLGPALYAVQFRWHHLKTPWYVPILASVGVLLMAVSVWQRRGVWRWASLALLVVVCALEWFFLLVAMRTPLYAGPAQPGRKVPAFTTTLAGGKAFTDQDLESGRRTILIFFRGRW